MECAKSLAKSAVFYLNVLYGLIGLTIKGMGIALLVKWITTTSNEDSIGISWLFYIMAGLLMCGAAIFACFAAVREKEGMLFAYAMFILTVFVVQVALAVWVALYTCIINGFFYSIFEQIISHNNTSTRYVNRKGCDTTIEILSELFTNSLCSAFHHSYKYCTSNQDLYKSWYTPTVYTIIGVPLIEVIVGCLALYLAIYLSITEKRSHAELSALDSNTVPLIKSTSEC